MSKTDISLAPVDSNNWNDIAVLEISEKRMGYTASGSYYLCLCHYDGMWKPLAVLENSEVAGFVMWAEEEETGGCWLGGLIIESGRDEETLGLDAVRETIRSLETRGYKDFYMSFTPGDSVLGEILRNAGFRDTGKEEEGEKIFRLSR